MANLFNNKWSIAALATTAIYVVFDNIVRPLLPKETATYEAVGVLGMDENQADPTLATQILKSAEVSQLFWKDVPQRDPFSPSVNIKANHLKELRATEKNIEKGIVKPLKRIGKTISYLQPPKLSALVSGETSKLVVLNNKICNEGSIIDGFEVIKINADHVLLKNLNNYNKIKITMENKK